jgi:CHASE3 domain sensor protein
MNLVARNEQQRSAQLAYDHLLPKFSEVNETALDKLRAMPLLLSEALTNQADDFFALIAPLLDSRRDTELGNALRKMRDDYANEQVETIADEAGITVNHAIARLRRAFA